MLTVLTPGHADLSCMTLPEKSVRVWLLTPDTKKQQMTERFTPAAHRHQRTSLRDGNTREEQRKKRKRAGHGVRNHFYGKRYD